MVQIVEKSWRQLLRDFPRRFDPWEEADVQSYLYHLCLINGMNVKRLHRERKYRKGTFEYTSHPKALKADLMYESDNQKRNLQVNIKWGYLENLGDKIKKGWLEDIAKLSKKTYKRNPIFVLFLTHEEDNRGYTPRITEKEFHRHKQLFKELESEANRKGVKVLTNYNI